MLHSFSLLLIFAFKHHSSAYTNLETFQPLNQRNL
jgi:hypothetical protein